MTPDQKLRALLQDYAHAEEPGAATGGHLRDEDFIRMIEAKLPAETDFSTAASAAEAALVNEIAPLRRHLAACDFCLDQFKDFYEFFAPAKPGEAVAGQREIDAAWQQFAPRIARKEPVPSFWARLFPAERKPNFFAAFGWGFTALLLVLTGFSAYIAWQAKSDRAQLSGEIEQQKQTYEERLKTLQQTAQNRDLAEQEKTNLAAEKDALQKRLAALQSELDRAKQEQKSAPTISPTSPANQSVPDNSLVAVNTPIYDVFPADSVVRGNGDASKNNFAVPPAAKNVVLILNAAGRADFPAYQAELVNAAGKTIWRVGGLRKDNLGNFTITLSRAALKPGHYRLKLSSGAQTVAEYAMTIGR